MKKQTNKAGHFFPLIMKRIVGRCIGPFSAIEEPQSSKTFIRNKWKDAESPSNFQVLQNSKVKKTGVGGDG